MAMTRSQDNYGNPYSSPKSNIGRALQTAMDRAANRMPAGYRVDAVSGQRRPGDTHNHDHGLAIDTKIYDPQGNYLGNYQDPSSFRAYEAYAQETRQQLYNMAHDPNVPAADRALAQQAYDSQRFGGYFSEGSKKPRDQMHQDENAALGMAGGGWLTGATGNKAYSAVSQPISTARWGLDAPGQTVSNADLGRATPSWSPTSPMAASQYEGVDAVGKAPVANASSLFGGPFSGLAGGVFAQSPAKPFSDTPTALGGITGQENGDFRAAPIGPLSAKWTMDAGAGPSLPFSTPRPPGAVFSQPQRPISATPASAYARAPQVPGYNALMGAVDHARPMPNLANTAVGQLMANTPQISAPYNVMAGTPRAPQAPGYNALMSAVDSAGPPQNPGLGGLLGTLGRAAMANPTRSTAAPAMGGYSPPAPSRAPQAPTGLGGYSPPAPGPSRQSPSDPKSFNASWAAARDFGMANAAPQAPQAPAMGGYSPPAPGPSYTTRQVANPDYGPALAAYNAAQAQTVGPAPGAVTGLKPGETAVGGIAGIGPQTYAPPVAPKLPSLPPQFITQRVPVAPRVVVPQAPAGVNYGALTGNSHGSLGSNVSNLAGAIGGYNDSNKAFAALGNMLGAAPAAPAVVARQPTVMDHILSAIGLGPAAAPMGTAMGGFGGSHGGAAGFGTVSGVSPGMIGGISGRNGTTSGLGGGRSGNDSGQQHG